MAERRKKTFFVESGMDLLLLDDSMTAFVDISSDSFYLTCFQNPCWIFSVFKNCISLLKFKFGVWKYVQNDFADGLLRCRSHRNRIFCKGSHLFISRRAQNLF